MPTRRGVLALGVAGVFGLAGCGRERAGDSVPEDAVPHGAEAGEPIDDVLERWRRQRENNAPFGLAATASLSGERLTVHAEGVEAAATVDGECTLRKEGPIEGGVVCAAATVDGEAADALVVRGSTLQANGTLRGLFVERVTCSDPLLARLEEPTLEEPPEYPEIPDSATEDSSRPVTQYVGGPLESVELSGFEEAYLVREGKRRELSEPIVVSAPSVWVEEGTVLESDAATLEATQFSVSAPEGASGTVAIEGREDVPSPYGVFGHDASLAVEPGGVDSEGSFRLTQVITEEEFLLESTVDILPATTSVTLPAGETRWIDAYYRERSYVGDGVLGEVAVDSDAEGLMTVPVEPPQLLVQQVVETLSSSGAGVLALGAVAPALVALAIGEGIATALDCAFNDCPSEQPYPAWADAGAVGRFYYRVDARGVEPGTYEATATLAGANYERREIPLTVEVTEPTSTPSE